VVSDPWSEHRGFDTRHGPPQVTLLWFCLVLCMRLKSTWVAMPEQAKDPTQTWWGKCVTCRGLAFSKNSRNQNYWSCMAHNRLFWICFQLCINLANEQLQHYFNEHIFQMELEDCRQEQISLQDGAVSKFTNNQPTIDLFLEVRSGGHLAQNKRILGSSLSRTYLEQEVGVVTGHIQ
jgi:hypothetical protein